MLIEVNRLSPDALAEARALALELDKRAYTVVADVFRSTQPAKRTPRRAGRVRRRSP